jgi:MFS family permease
VHWIIIPSVVISFVFSLIMPSLSNLLNQWTPNAMRATVLSFTSIISTAMLTIFDPSAGAVMDAFGPRYGFVLIGCAAMVFSVYHMVRFDRVLPDQRDTSQLSESSSST